jgi:hypothetical protein
LTQERQVILDRVIKIGLIVFSVALLLLAVLSFRWHMQRDPPLFFYVSFLMEHGKIPYKDIFEMNVPGTYLAYSIIGKITHYNESAIRCVDLFILLVIAILNWIWMKRIDSRSAWFGSVAWGFSYLGIGPEMSLQREYLILVPLLIGILISNVKNQTQKFSLSLITGFCFGFAATIKPHSLIGLVALLAFQYIDSRQNYIRKILIPTFIGVMLPLIGFGIWLYVIGAHQAFLDIVVNYWPLYTHINGQYTTISGTARLVYLFQKVRTFAGLGLWVAAAVMGSYVALFVISTNQIQKRQVTLLLFLAVAYTIYPIFAGQFFTYHWLLYLFFIIQLSSLCLAKQPTELRPVQRMFPVLVLIFVIFTSLPVRVFFTMLTKHSPDKREERVNQISNFLKENIVPGDTVQPLDWTGGTIHALLRSKTMIATPFIYDFHFYHHVSNSYIQQLRNRFIQALTNSRPRFILQVTDEDKPWVSGADTTREFKELQSILDDQYKIVRKGDGYLIYQIK